MKTLLRWLGRGLAALAVLVLILIGLRLYARHRFVADWKQRFPAYKDDIDRLPSVDLAVGLPSDDSQIPQPIAGAKLVRFRFPDGSWFAAAEHDTHDEGLEWDAAVFYDSRGGFTVTKHHFCGWEGLSGELKRYSMEARSLEDFHKTAAAIW